MKYLSKYHHELNEKAYTRLNIEDSDFKKRQIIYPKYYFKRTNNNMEGLANFLLYMYQKIR